ncbi:hypothetical protein L7F22_040311 [Adiantum nelumboides]|nr:hypothetical protein [Adiantum nelumboides]
MSSEPLLDVIEVPVNETCRHEGDFLLPQLSVKLKGDVIVANKKFSRRTTWVAQCGQERLINPCNIFLRRGLEPKFLSLSMALGITLGLFPICGITILLCAIAAVILQSNCHIPTLMLSNIAVSPLQLMMPFMRVGELVTGADHSPVAPDGFWIALRGHEPHAVINGLMLHVIIGWCLFAPLSVGILYIVSFPVFYVSLTRGVLDVFLQCHDGLLSSMDAYEEAKDDEVYNFFLSEAICVIAVKQIIPEDSTFMLSHGLHEEEISMLSANGF